MIWDHPEKDHYRWRIKFALWPRRVGSRRVWLCQYAYRYLTTEERRQYDPMHDDLYRLSFPTWTMWQTPDGYTCLRKSNNHLGFSFHYWREIQEEKPPLNVVTLPISGDVE